MFGAQRLILPGKSVRYPEPFFGQVSCLLHMDGSNGGTTFTDHGPNNITVTAGNGAVTATGTKKYGTASADLRNGGTNTGYLEFSNNSLFDLPGDFTIEAFVNTTQTSSFQPLIFATAGAGWSASVLAFYITTSNKLRAESQGTTHITAGTTLSANTWYHVALVRIGSGLTIYLDGVSDGTGTTATSFVGNSARIGHNSAAVGSNQQVHFVDEFRLTRAARYTGNFTPPAAAFVPP